MIEPGYYDIIARKATFTKKFIWKDDTGTPINLTGYTAIMEIKNASTDATALLTLSTANGGITLGGANGEINLALSETAISALAVGSYVYDMKFTQPDTTTLRLLEGKFVLMEYITT